MIDRDDSAERTDARLENDPIEATHANDPMDPIDNTLPTEPIDRIELRLPMLRIEFSDRHDHIEVPRVVVVLPSDPPSSVLIVRG